MFTILFATINALIVLLTVYNFYLKRRKLPPGPTPLPLIGNMHSVNAKPPGEECFKKWMKQYGPIFTFWLGEQPVVMITDYELIKKTFQKDGDAYAGRLVYPEMDQLVKGGTYGVIFTEGELWREHRRFALHTLRDFGVGKNIMQDKILTELGARFDKLDDELGDDDKDVDVASILDLAVGSIINNLLFGYRFDGAHECEFFELKELMRVLGEQMMELRFQWLNQFPHTITKLPYFRGYLEEFRVGMYRLYAFYERQIEAHRGRTMKSLDDDVAADDDDTPCTDYVEAFFKERRRRERAGEHDHNYTLEQLRQMCSDLWVAGQETTSKTLGWGVAYILHNPRVQQKLHCELDTIIGDAQQFVTVENRPHLPYTNAVVDEIQRMANLLPMNLLHRTTRDVTVNGYSLPKGTCVVPQISAILCNEEYFANPNDFNPDRFLTADGNLAKCDELIPFSIGKRQCLGEPLARMELFLFVANLFNRYTLSPADSPPSLTRTLAITVHCPTFSCKIKKRI